MKISKSALKQIIKEELENINEDERTVQSMQDELTSEVQDMEYQSAMKYLKNMFRAIQKVMVDITPLTPPEDPGMDMDSLDEQETSTQEPIAKLDPELKSAIDRLIDKFDDLDLSIDFLAAAVTDGDALTIGTGQKLAGRYAKPIKRKTSNEDM